MNDAIHCCLLVATVVVYLYKKHWIKATSKGILPIANKELKKTDQRALLFQYVLFYFSGFFVLLCCFSCCSGGDHITILFILLPFLNKISCVQGC